MKNERITPELITDLGPDEIFVFGSNQPGRHGRGSAKTAMRWGAKYGHGEGLVGRTYALPTKGQDLRQSLSLAQIGGHVDRFLACARGAPALTFLVTRVGCGLAGYRPEQIAPLLAGAVALPNVHLPAVFWWHLR